MVKKLAAAVLGLGFLWSGGTAHAYIYNERMCSYGAASPIWNVGSTMVVDFNGGRDPVGPWHQRRPRGLLPVHHKHGDVLQHLSQDQPDGDHHRSWSPLLGHGP
ncbi:hypothetical protein POL68_38185 [Stigmatella sp. ncwal1]|uniref:Uncharacterized protein n=1 Tax=Stigmatella ashevillensis TaxID=2995309 RepID=A0ABT5DPN5_9BACT|nr:hypothetical protein [Stigmatella ashevillena]MDC0714347.1 hypothetical protein [Stigmatella ashevillena]